MHAQVSLFEPAVPRCDKPAVSHSYRTIKTLSMQQFFSRSIEIAERNHMKIGSRRRGNQNQKLKKLWLRISFTEHCIVLIDLKCR